MSRIYQRDSFHVASYGLGQADEQSAAPSKNHKASEDSALLQAKIASMGLLRIAGNVYECPSSHDFWAVKGGNLRRLTADEVDNGDKLVAAPSNSPAAFLEQILGDLTF